MTTTMATVLPNVIEITYRIPGGLGRYVILRPTPTGGRGVVGQSYSPDPATRFLACWWRAYATQVVPLDRLTVMAVHGGFRLPGHVSRHARSLRLDRFCVGLRRRFPMLVPRAYGWQLAAAPREASADSDLRAIGATHPDRTGVSDAGPAQRVNAPWAIWSALHQWTAAS
jgi:hypothetical protein